MIRTPKNNQKGFTAIELLMGVLILLIVAAVATPFFLGTMQNYRLRGAAWQVAGDLRLARQKSVASGRPYRLQLQVHGAASNPNSYTVERQEVSGTWTKDPANRIYLQTPGGPTYVMIDPTSNPPGYMIAFKPNGTLQAYGTIKLMDNRDKRYEVVINWVGRVRVVKI